MKKELLKIFMIVGCLVIFLMGCSLNEIVEEVNNISENVENVIEEETKSKVEFTRGSWDGLTYQNEFFDLKMEFPEGWEFLSDDELKEKYGKIDDGKNAYLFYGAISNGAQNTCCISEKVISSIDVKTYESSLISQFEKLDDYNYTVKNSEDVVIGDNTFRKLELTALIYNVPIYQNYYMKKEGDYIVSIILTGISQEQVTEMEGYIQ